MKYNVRIMKPAQIDLNETYIHIAEELKNPEAAVRRVSLIDEKIQSLKNDPFRIPLVRDGYLASKGYRMIIAKNHLVFFIIREEIKMISIMRILYGRRDWMRILQVDEEG